MGVAIIIFILSIVLVSFGFAGLMVRSQNRFKLERETIQANKHDNSLGTGELRALIQDSVLEAISPLEERMDTMEESMRQLPAPAPAKRALDLGEDR